MNRGGRLPGITVATHAVLDVELQPPERLHQRFDVEGFVGSGAEIPQQAGAQGRLHQRPESQV
jgi:hypothetical protein